MVVRNVGRYVEGTNELIVNGSVIFPGDYQILILQLPTKEETTKNPGNTLKFDLNPNSSPASNSSPTGRQIECFSPPHEREPELSEHSWELEYIKKRRHVAEINNHGVLQSYLRYNSSLQHYLCKAQSRKKP